MSDVLVSAEEQLDVLDEVRTLIGTAIVPDPPPTIKDGGLIREGYDAALDELKYISKNGKSWIANFQAEEIALERASIPSRLGTTRYLDIILKLPMSSRIISRMKPISGNRHSKRRTFHYPGNSRNMKQKC